MRRFFTRWVPVLTILALWWIPARAAIGPTMVCGDDMLLHLLRVVQIDYLWSQGVFYARLAPDMGWGFGYPVFNFYPPLSYYVALVVARLGFGITPGVRIAQALTFLLAGLGVYFLARDFLREEAALVAGVAAMYAPYVAYNPLYRGALPEAMGWALLPWAWWAVGRAVRTGRRGWIAAGALLFGALLITHSVAAVVGTPLVSLYALMEALSRSPFSPRRNLLTATAVVGLGLGLSLFFWIPAWAERPLVQLERVPYGFPGGYRSHFFSLSYTVFAWEPVRPDLVNPYPPRSLGLVATLLGLPGLLVGLFRFSDHRRRQVAFFSVVFLLSTLMALPISGPAWESISFLHNFQFPWRFLGPASLSLAVLIGATVELVGRSRWRNLAVVLITLALILADLGWLYNARFCPGWDEVSIGSLRTYEHVGGGVGTSGGEFLPRLVQGRPPFSAGNVFEPTLLPDGATLQEKQTGLFSAEAWVESPRPFQMTVNRFYYPGWRAWVDGQEVEVAPETEWGRFTFPVPAGRHHIAVRFGETPLRLAADILSVLSLMALVLVVVFTPVLPPPSTGEGAETPTPTPPPPSAGEGEWGWGSSPSTREGAGGWGLWLLPLLATAAVLLVERFQLPPVYERRLTEGGIRGVSIPMHIVYDNQFHLLGTEPLPVAVPADQPVPVRFYWWDAVPGGPDYRVQPDLKDEAGQIWNSPAIPPASYRSAPRSPGWPPDQYAITALNIHPFLGTPPGVYTVTLTVFDGETLLPYTAVEDGRALGPEVILGTVQLIRPAAPPSLAALGIPETTPMPSWGPIRLLRGTMREQESRPGDPLHLELYWEASEAPDEDYRMKVWVDGPGGREWERPLTRADFLTTEWRKGDRWLGLHTLRLPPSLESGEHGLWLQLCRREGDECRRLGEPALLGTVRIEAPARSWAVPPLRVWTDAPLGGEVTLVGASWAPEGNTLQAGSALTVTLVWRGEREMETSYRVFLHLLGPDGSLVAQSDGEPAGWTRPTTGWLPGEVIVDERVLVLPPDLPPGEYRLMAGMYRYGGPRLTTPDGADAILLLQLLVR